MSNMRCWAIRFTWTIRPEPCRCELVLASVERVAMLIAGCLEDGWRRFERFPDRAEVLVGGKWRTMPLPDAGDRQMRASVFLGTMISIWLADNVTPGLNMGEDSTMRERAVS